MIKISANLSKKVPIPSTEFSSQQFGAAMEIEVSGSENSETIQLRIRELYDLLNSAVDEQIAAQGSSPEATKVRTTAPSSILAPSQGKPNAIPTVSLAPTSSGTNGHGRASSKRTTASEAQCRAIYAICKSLNLDMNAVLAKYNVSDARQLAIKDASSLIDELKSNNGLQPQR